MICEFFLFNFSYVTKSLPKRSKKHPEVFRYDEWMKVIGNIDPFYRPIAEAMIMTGMIGSEVAGLRKKDILDDHLIIQNSIVRNHEKTDLKPNIDQENYTSQKRYIKILIRLVIGQ